MSDVEEFDSDEEEKPTNAPPIVYAAKATSAVPVAAFTVVPNDDDLDPENMDDFEYQLKLEELERKRIEEQNAAASADGSTSGNSTTYVDPSDGTVYEWDFAKQAWFPKIDEDFIAQYQANYGSHPLDLSQVSANKETSNEPQMDPKQKKELIKQEKKAKRKIAVEKAKNPGWFEIDESHNTNVYVSGLPINYTIAQFEELMSKYGIIARELENKNLKLKLYKDADGNTKGDGLCCFIKKESVELALQILDGSTIGDNKVHVERAHFEQKGDFDPAKKRKKLTNKQKKRLKEKQERMFDWHPEKLKGERAKSDATVVLKNVFTLRELEENPPRLLELREELKNECAKYGEVKKVVVYDNNKEGVATITFAEPEDADDCITMMNYRIFHGKQLRAETWDGKTKYKSDESHEDQERRLSTWHEFLEAPESSSTVPKASTSSTAELSSPSKPESSAATSEIVSSEGQSS